MKCAFVFKDEKSEKFWAINYSGNSYSVNYGKIGTTGRYDVKEFDTDEKCESEALRQISQKAKKGYMEASDFDFINRLYFDNEEIGLHPKTSHPHFVEHFTDDFYYDCSDDYAPFGNDNGSDAYGMLVEHIKDNIKKLGLVFANVNVAVFPKELVNSYEFSFFAPENLDVDYIEQFLKNPTTEIVEGITSEDLLFTIDETIIGVAFGQIKITGTLQDRLRCYVVNSIKRLEIARKLLGHNPNPYAEKMLADIESFPKPEKIEPSENAKTIIEYLDCPCEIFKDLIDDDNLIFAYENALSEGKEKGFIPLMIVPSDTMLEMMEIHCDDFNIEPADKDGLRKIRDLFIEKANALNPSECIEKLIAEFKEAVEDDGDEWENVIGKILKGDELCSFDSYWDHDNEVMAEVILAKIPVKNPWELAAWIPMGGFNDCPLPHVQVAVMKHWYEKYSAIPSIVTYDTWEFSVLNYDEKGGFPIEDKKEAMKLAIEQAAFCLDKVNDEKIGQIAGGLMKSKVWYFWWD